ncbi:MAG: chorismate mutase [Bacteriovoracia bacterium]
MSPSSRESELNQLREALAQLNSEFFLTLAERRNLTVRIQEIKARTGRYSHYDPEREREVLGLVKVQLKNLTLKELLAFSLVMEDHAMAMAPGSYPAWSNFTHLIDPKKELYEMINPLMLKISHPDFFARLNLSQEFGFLKDF